MDATNILTEFFRWCSVINVALLATAAVAILLFAGPVRRIHSGMFGISGDNLPRAVQAWNSHLQHRPVHCAAHDGVTRARSMISRRLGSYGADPSQLMPLMYAAMSK